MEIKNLEESLMEANENKNLLLEEKEYLRIEKQNLTDNIDILQVKKSS